MKNNFPIFKNQPNLIYLDSASTALKPEQVINAEMDYYQNYSANVHRGIYNLSEQATTAYEQARKTVALFIGAQTNEVIFTSGATQGLNGLAQSLQISGLLPQNPKILLSIQEHHSNILPWQRIQGAQVDYLNLNAELELDLSNLPDTDYNLISLSLVSNVTGNVLTRSQITKLKSAYPNAIFVMDACQALAHMPVNVMELDVDALVFSGHKLYGPTGVGVLWIKSELANKLEPFNVGGGMIVNVFKHSATWAAAPQKFEAGTPPIAQAIGLAEGIKFIQQTVWEEIVQQQEKLTKYLVSNLETIPDLNIYHATSSNLGVVSCSFNNIHAHDVAQVLSDMNICVRAGHHCTQILHKEVFNVSSTFRISLGVYNSQADIDALIEGLKQVKLKLG